MNVEIQREQTSAPIKYNAINTYQKGAFYCVVFEYDRKRIVHKYPVESIFRVVEDYNESKR